MFDVECYAVHVRTEDAKDAKDAKEVETTFLIDDKRPKNPEYTSECVVVGYVRLGSIRGVQTKEDIENHYKGQFRFKKDGKEYEAIINVSIIAVDKSKIHIRWFKKNALPPIAGYWSTVGAIVLSHTDIQKGVQMTWGTFGVALLISFLTAFVAGTASYAKGKNGATPTKPKNGSQTSQG